MSFIPGYADQIETHEGVIYKSNGTYYKRIRRGYGFVVVRTPYKVKRHLKGHSERKRHKKHKRRDNDYRNDGLEGNGNGQHHGQRN
ncbi:MAG: hypothetical protein GY816_18145 [Cytophagales bacterium]|nr:hypothetical protein [Cytophagales bacterium]